MLKQIHHKKNELFEVELYQDKECTEAFDFTNAENLYIELKDGDVTPLLQISKIHSSLPTGNFTIFTPYIQSQVKEFFIKGYTHQCGYRVKTLEDITPNLSKYIPEDNAVLFLSEEDCKKYSPIKKYDYNEKGNFSNPENVNDIWLTTFDAEYNTLIAKIGVGLYDVEDDCLYKRCPESGNRIYFKKLTIFLLHGTQSELEKANEIAKELKEKYGVEDVNLFVLHNFHHNCITYNDNTMYFNGIKTNVFWNKIITTNSTGILKPEDSNERLQVIDCKEFFEEYLNKNNLI